MPFFVAEADLSGNINSGTIVQLSPAPTWVTYPEKLFNTVRLSKDGNAIIQGPNKDGRTRTWVYKRYRATIPHYTTLFTTLIQYSAKNRLNATPAKSPWVYVMDTETGNLVYKQWTGTTWVETATWVRVKVTQVTQDLAQQGGPAVYETTKFDFVIDDPRWNNF